MNGKSICSAKRLIMHDIAGAGARARAVRVYARPATAFAALMEKHNVRNTNALMKM